MTETAYRECYGHTVSLQAGCIMVFGILMEMKQNTENMGQTASREGMKRDAEHFGGKRDDPLKY